MVSHAGFPSSDFWRRIRRQVVMCESVYNVNNKQIKESFKKERSSHWLGFQLMRSLLQ